MEMKKNVGFLAIVATVLMTACTYQKNNRIEQKDVNAGNDYVYGHPDSMARQRKVQYTPNSENEVRAMEIQEILYGGTANEADSVAAL